MIGGMISPIHHLHKKSGVLLASNEHRNEMIRLSLLFSDWIRFSDHETSRADWIPADEVLQYYQVLFFFIYVTSTNKV